jgi:hypothetical protein
LSTSGTVGVVEEFLDVDAVEDAHYDVVEQHLADELRDPWPESLLVGYVEVGVG